MRNSLLLPFALVLLQTTPQGGAISKLVPPVPTPASFISDARGVLAPAARAELDARITAIQGAGLGDIAVAILPSIESYSPYEVGVEIYRTWKVGSVAAIGSARRNVGVLILIVPKELAPDNKGHCWITTGTGSEGIITDGTAGSICRDRVIPHLRNRDYAAGIEAAISGIEERLRGDTALAAAALDDPGDADRGIPPAVPIGFGGALLAIAAVVGGMKYRRYRRRPCSRCGLPMRRLDERSDDAKLNREEALEEKLGSVDYDVWVCGCGGTSVLPYRAWFSKYNNCKECKRRTASSRRITLDVATTTRTGLAEDRFHCKSCDARWNVRVVLPRIQESSSGGSGGGGGGGGSSFGGSGATSGGGGGGSY